MSKNKFFEFFCFIFLFFFLHIHTVFAFSNGQITDTTDMNLENACDKQDSDQKQIIASTWNLDDGKFYYGQTENVLKGRITYEQEHAFQVTS